MIDPDCAKDQKIGTIVRGVRYIYIKISLIYVRKNHLLREKYIRNCRSVYHLGPILVKKNKNRTIKHDRLVLIYLCNLLLLNSYAPEPNPGPATKYPCGSCNKAVT